MITAAILLQSSNGDLLFGYLTDSATILIFGTCLVVATIGLRKFLKYQDGKANQNHWQIGEYFRHKIVIINEKRFYLLVLTLECAKIKTLTWNFPMYLFTYSIDWKEGIS